MAVDNFMELVHKDVYVSEMETEEPNSWHHGCAEAPEMATCGKVMGRRKTSTGRACLRS